jgi:hypothetical protein
MQSEFVLAEDRKYTHSITIRALSLSSVVYLNISRPLLTTACFNVKKLCFSRTQEAYIYMYPVLIKIWLGNLEIQVFCDVTLCHWVNGSRRYEQLQSTHLPSQTVHEENSLTLKTRALQHIKMPGTIYLTT